MRFLPILLLLFPIAGMAQPNRGELRLQVHDPSGAGLRASVELTSSANGYRESFVCDEKGTLAVRLIPFGVYQVRVEEPGFGAVSETVEIHSAVPEEKRILLSVAAVHAEVRVTAADTLLDPGSVSSVAQIGEQQIEQRLSSLPGRSVQDLVVSQPGWLFEGNAVLHPRGSEYQTQFVVDGIPLIDDRSPGSGPEIEADDLQSMSIYTAGFPAEYGRKMGGVVELNTRQQADKGLHGKLVLSGGSYDTASGYGELQETRGGSTAAASAAGAQTSHFLNPVVPQNYTNRGTSADFSARFDHEFNASDRLSMSVRRELSRFLVPNELVQEQAGQIQNGDNFETMALARWQHIVSGNSLFVVSGMVRRNSRDLDSNVHPDPIAAFQHNRFGEGYFKATFSLHHGHQELKAGVESDNLFLHEQFSYQITDPTQFDAGTPASLSFAADRPDLEQSAFAEDLLHWSRWTLSAGLRWDHYQLLLNRAALSPRLSLARFVPSANLLLHLSYDRIFQTPSFENILLSSSAQVRALSSEFLRLPVQPSSGNDFEAGAAKGFHNHVRFDWNVYRRQARNFADDNQLLNTGVSYPIAFDRAAIYGAESKLEVVKAGHLSGFASYSWMVGKVWFPVTGGLFLGDDAENALSKLSGHFANTQDQRNTLATRWEYGAGARVRIAAGAAYGSGLPFDYGGTEAQALAQYGPEVVSRLNFARGRIRPTLAVSSSLAVDVVSRDHLKMTMHVDGENLNDRLNVLDFGGLFSGNAIAPGRSVLVRWDARF